MEIPTPQEIEESDLVTGILSDIASNMLKGRGSITMESVPGFVRDTVVAKLRDRGWTCTFRCHPASYRDYGGIKMSYGSMITFSWTPT
jgi:hypothetical protein